jgi:hypothetical protein
MQKIKQHVKDKTSTKEKLKYIKYSYELIFLNEVPLA